MTLNCYKLKFYRNFAGFCRFGRQQQLNEWRSTCIVSDRIDWPQSRVRLPYECTENSVLSYMRTSHSHTCSATVYRSLFSELPLSTIFQFYFALYTYVIGPTNWSRYSGSHGKPLEQRHLLTYLIPVALSVLAADGIILHISISANNVQRLNVYSSRCNSSKQSSPSLSPISHDVITIIQRQQQAQPRQSQYIAAVIRYIGLCKSPASINSAPDYSRQINISVYRSGLRWTRPSVTVCLPVSGSLDT